MQFPSLIHIIQQTHKQSQNYALQEVNNSLTIRNWLIGCYLVEYEQNGEDKAVYGDKLLIKLAKELKSKGLNSVSETHLRIYRQFFNLYPQIRQTVSDKFLDFVFQSVSIHQTVSDELKVTTKTKQKRLSTKPKNLEWQEFSTLSKNSRTISAKSLNESTTLEIIPFVEIISYENVHPDSLRPDILLKRLIFSHFIELIKAETPLKRAFYEIQSIKNNWSVRELKRAMGTFLFERTGASWDKENVIAKIKDSTPVLPADIIKNPYILEFLGLEPKSEYTETDLEQAIINHLQKFLVEMGRGFCFEARQKRITFDNKHYYIDLVFYHRILKCHIIVDLKLGEFGHEDAGQMNVYLNYYKDNETTDGDNPPIGIILCAQKNDSLVKYATGGLPQEVFVGKYMIELPSIEELKNLIETDIKELK